MAHVSGTTLCLSLCPVSLCVTLRRALGSPCCGGWRARVRAGVFLIRLSVSRRLGGFHVEAPVSHAAVTWVGGPGFRTVVSFPFPAAQKQPWSVLSGPSPCCPQRQALLSPCSQAGPTRWRCVSAVLHPEGRNISPELQAQTAILPPGDVGITAVDPSARV